MNKIKLFTHGADLDGIGSAILAYLVFGQDNVDVEYCNYDDVDEKVEDLVEQEELFRSYDRVFITDISISDSVANMIDILDCPPKRVRLFDHHATALWLNKYGWSIVSVDSDFHETKIKTSGTDLFFKYLLCNGLSNDMSSDQNRNLCRFVQIVRDYDTWRWKELGDEGIVCKQVNDLFHIYGREEFIEWAMRQIRGLDYVSPLQVFPHFSEIDKVLLDQKQKDIDRYVEQKNKQLQGPFKDHLGYTYAIVFAEQYFSELGNRLCEMNDCIDYVAMIDISRGQVSYRCIKDNIDLGNEIAHSFGGGGHKKAAGSRFDLEYVQSRIMNEIFFYKADELE